MQFLMGGISSTKHSNNGKFLLFQMTVVEVYAGERKIKPLDKGSPLSSMLSSLLIEGIAQNTNGSVFIPEASARN